MVVHGQSATTPPAEVTTTISLLPAGGSTPLSSVSNASNVFLATYISNGTQQITYIGDSPVSLTTEPGTNVTIQGTSRYLGLVWDAEWVLDSDRDPATVPSGSSATLYYYELLDEPAFYSVVDGGNPPSPDLTYSSAPSSPSSTGLSVQNTLSLTQNPQALWAQIGTTVSVSNPLSGNSTVRWATQASSWTLSNGSEVQVPGPIEYYHQYYVSLQYSVSGGTGYSAPNVTCPAFGTSESAQAGNSAWVDAGREDSWSSCAYSPLLPGSSQNQQWAIESESSPIEGPGTITENYQLQDPLSVSYSILGAAPPSPPAITSTFFGQVSTISLPSNMSIVWIDSGSAYSLSNPLPLSNSTERWITTSETTGVLARAASISVTFQQQFLISASYVIAGGGNPPAPTLSYVNFGNPENKTLTASPQTFWADGETSYAAPSQLTGSTSTERWYSPGTSGITDRSVDLALVYHHQFYFSITGGDLGSEWFDANVTASVTFPGVYDRAAGAGQRVVSYALDGRSPISITPTTQNISISIAMLGPHQLVISSVEQYQVRLDKASLAAAFSITHPTINGDSYWYDAGDNVSIVLNGVWGRQNGTGYRLSSYSVNGGSPIQVMTTETVTALSIDSISSPQVLTAVSVTQYYFEVSSGSLVSLSQPTIPGDVGWYDLRAVVNATFDYSWDVVPNQSRLNAVGFTMNGGAETPLSRSGSGTFVLPITVSEALKIGVENVTQYHLGLVGGSSVKFSVPSPTGDDFFDAGTDLRVTTANTWGLVSGNTRQRLVSFTLDGEVTNVTQASSGTATTPVITFNSPHQLSFASVTQYLVTFQFTDFSGKVSLSPRAFEITLNGSAENLSGSKLWFDSGTRFNVTKVAWEGVEVPSVGPSGGVTTRPQTLTVRAAIYQASLKVVDLLGLPVSGVDVSLTFGNQTRTTIATGGDGVVSLGLLPAGTYRALVAGLAGSTNVSINPASERMAVVNVIFSYVTITIIIVAVMLACVGIGLVLFRRSRASRNEGFRIAH